MFPGGIWVLETDRQYVITVDVYDKLNHKLYVAEVGNFQFFFELIDSLILTFTPSFHSNMLPLIKRPSTNQMHPIYPVKGSRRGSEIS